MINININNDDKNRRKFTSIALIVDRDDFLTETKLLREKYQIDISLKCSHGKRKYFLGLLNKKLTNSDILKIWFATNYKILFNSKPDNNEPLEQKILFLNKIANLITAEVNPYAEEICRYFKEDIISLRKRLRVSPTMDRIMAHAIICGTVNDSDIRLAYGELEFDEGKEKIGIPVTTNYCIKLTMNATIDDVIEAYRKDILPFQSQKWGLDMTIPQETKKEIIRDRKRYWLHKEGWTYKEIAANEIESNGLKKYKKIIKTKKTEGGYSTNNQPFIKYIEEQLSGIKKSVKRYEKLLRNK